VRSATAAGITVVVAAGNFGQNGAGAQRYGSISSPGNDPSVITVGSVNTKGSAVRGDDTVNFFSSRGPTLGGYVDAYGVRQPDNLLKPDLVAPGNKVVGVLARAARVTTWPRPTRCCPAPTGCLRSNPTCSSCTTSAAPRSPHLRSRGRWR
jgi:subtilisin family serine protease